LEVPISANDVLLGTAIADATLRRRSLNQNASIRVGHSIDKAEYVFWKYKHLRKLVEIRNFNMIEGGRYRRSPNDYVFFQSVSSPVLTEVRELVYQNGRKTISDEFLSRVNETVLAVWFMDDGSYGSHPNSMNYTLSTDAFTFAENERLAQFLTSKFDLSPRLQHIKRSDRWVIRFLKHDSPKIENLIGNCVNQVSCMKYKLASSHGADGLVA